MTVAAGLELAQSPICRTLMVAGPEPRTVNSVLGIVAAGVVASRSIAPEIPWIRIA